MILVPMDTPGVELIRPLSVFGYMGKCSVTIGKMESAETPEAASSAACIPCTLRDPFGPIGSLVYEGRSRQSR